MLTVRLYRYTMTATDLIRERRLEIEHETADDYNAMDATLTGFWHGVAATGLMPIGQIYVEALINDVTYATLYQSESAGIPVIDYSGDAHDPRGV